MPVEAFDVGKISGVFRAASRLGKPARKRRRGKRRKRTSTWTIEGEGVVERAMRQKWLGEETGGYAGSEAQVLRRRRQQEQQAAATPFQPTEEGGAS